MTIYISNDLYLGSIESGGVANRPFVGWHSVFDLNSVSATGTAITSMPAGSVWSADTYTYWQSSERGLAPSGSRDLVFSNNDGGAVDYIGIYGHNFNSGGISYLLQSSNNGSDWTNITSSTIPNSDYPLINYFDSITANFFRLRMGLPVPTPGAKVTHVKIGRITQLERPRYVGDIPGGMDLRVEKIGSNSYSGQHLGSVLVSEGDSFNITQENNTPEFCRSTDLKRFFRHAIQLEKLSNGPAESFFYAWRPDQYPNEVQYCGQTMSFNPPTNQRPNGMMQWSMQGDAFKRKLF